MPRGPMIGSLGELLVEFISSERDGHNLRPATYVGPFPSGAPGIFIDQAARIGGAAIFAGAVGADAFGQVLRQRLAASGVDDRLIRVVPDVPTGTAHVSYNSDGSRDFVFNIARSASAHLPSVGEAIAGFLNSGTTVLHISGSTLGNADMRARAISVCEGARAKGVAVSIDPNIRVEVIGDPGYFGDVRKLMAIADYVLPSDADADLLFPGQGFGDWSAELLAGGARVVALKRGDRGAVLRDAGGVVDLPGHAVDVVDPTGAGDCFCATLVTLFAGGRDLATAGVLANAAGALAVQKLGPMEGNSTLAEAEAFLRGRG